MIIGSQGFLGKNLCNFFLQKGFQVHRLSREHGDLRQKSTWKSVNTKRKYDAVFFCAERTGNQLFFEQNTPFDIFMENFSIIKLFEEFVLNLEFPTKVFSFSSLWTAATYCSVISERDLFQYDAKSNIAGLLLTKISLLELVKKLNKISQHDATMITTGTLYGPGDSSDHLVPSLLKKVMSRPEFVDMSGDGNSVRNYIYVDDFCECLMTILNSSKPSCESLIVSSNINIRVTELVDSIVTKFGVTSVKWGDRPDNFTKRIPDTSTFTDTYKMGRYVYKDISSFSEKELSSWVFKNDH